jgi:hypothetical protein
MGQQIKMTESERDSIKRMHSIINEQDTNFSQQDIESMKGISSELINILKTDQNLRNGGAESIAKGIHSIMKGGNPDDLRVTASSFGNPDMTISADTLFRLLPIIKKSF